ncbi:hypothetical protein C3L33_10163, partial [Rhododendron williamsianum]
MSSSEPISGDGGEDRELADVHVVELVAASTDESGPDSILQEQIAPLLAPLEKPKINIFAISYPRRKPKRGPRDDVPLFALRLDKAGKHAVISLCIKVGVETEYDIIE